jgi:hypothetical protein
MFQGIDTVYVVRCELFLKCRVGENATFIVIEKFRANPSKTPRDVTRGVVLPTCRLFRADARVHLLIGRHDHAEVLRGIHQ